MKKLIIILVGLLFLSCTAETVSSDCESRVNAKYNKEIREKAKTQAEINYLNRLRNKELENCK